MQKVVKSNVGPQLYIVGDSVFFLWIPCSPTTCPHCRALWKTLAFGAVIFFLWAWGACKSNSAREGAKNSHFFFPLSHAAHPPTLIFIFFFLLLLTPQVFAHPSHSPKENNWFVGWEKVCYFSMQYLGKLQENVTYNLTKLNTRWLIFLSLLANVMKVHV